MQKSIGNEGKKTSQDLTTAEIVWQVLLSRCAATPKRDWHKVRRLSLVSFKDIQAAIKEIEK